MRFDGAERQVGVVFWATPVDNNCYWSVRFFSLPCLVEEGSIHKQPRAGNLLSQVISPRKDALENSTSVNKSASKRRRGIVIMATQPRQQPQAVSHSTSLTIRDPDLANALECLRNKPVVELSAVRTLHIRLNETNLLYWYGSVLPGAHEVFDDEDLEVYTRIYPVPESLRISSPSEVFRAMLRFIAESFDLGKLDLEVNISAVAWSLFEDRGAGAYGGEVDEEWKFIYDFFMDVGRALAEVFKGSDLREIRVETSIWDGMGPWLSGQISGRETAVVGNLPEYHDIGMHLLSDKAASVQKGEQI